MPQTLKWEVAPFNKKIWGVRLQDTVADSKYHAPRGGANVGNFEWPPGGALRHEHAMYGQGDYANVRCQGECWFRWGVNRSGGALVRGQVGRFYANQAVTADAAGTVSSFVDTGQFTANEEVGNLFYCLDNNDAAGAAPEGEGGVIVANDANTLYIQPNATAAYANADTGIIVARSKVTVLASALERQETFGVVMATSLADNYWGWWLCYGVTWVYVKAATAITQGIGLIGDLAGRLTNSSTSGQDIMLARALVNCSGDIASDIIPVFFDVYRGLPFTSA